MEAINEFIVLKGKLNTIKDFMNIMIDSPQSGLEGGYNVNKATDELTLAINRLEHEFGIFDDSRDSDTELTKNAPYGVCISDILTELKGIDIPSTSNMKINGVSFCIDNSKMWLFEELKRIARLNS